ncbi:MAG TPA: metallophosphoesterase [Chthoniobacterales bacterium]
MSITRRAFLKRTFAAGAFFGVGSVAYAGGYERHGVQVVRQPLRLGLSTPLRAALLTDIHFDPLYETGWLRHVFALVADARPDLILYAGDYVTKTTARFEEFGRIVGSYRAPLGACASLGNHDHWTDRWSRRGEGSEKIRSVFAANGIQLLRNAVVPLPHNPGWALAGFESFWAGHPNRKLLTHAPADTQFISLVHEPDAWDVLVDPRIRLQVSGHTHGGQVRAPFYGALRLPTWGRKYDAGLFSRGGRHLYVSRGIGTVNIPCRVNCSPEITILELT